MGFDSTVCLARDCKGKINAYYPGKVFGEFALGIGSKRYIKRFLDAMKSTFPLAKGVIPVEGITEQLVLLYLADYLDRPVEDLHTTVASVGGSIFGHLLKLFGAGVEACRQNYVLPYRVDCLIDIEPSKLKDNLSSCEKCWPFKISKNISIGNALDELRRQKVVAFANAYLGRPLVIRWLPPCYSSWQAARGSTADPLGFTIQHYLPSQTNCLLVWSVLKGKPWWVSMDMYRVCKLGS